MSGVDPGDVEQLANQSGDPVGRVPAKSPGDTLTCTDAVVLAFCRFDPVENGWVVGAARGSEAPLAVRLISPAEVARFNSEFDAHHWLGHRLTGEVMRYVATQGERWVALVGFGSAAFKCGPREKFLGWPPEAQFRRLRYVVGNQRFCVLPAVRQPNLASAVLARALRRVSADYQSAYGHPVLAVETFTDPARHSGACYAAANFTPLGATLGFARSGGRYRHHGAPKLAWCRLLRPDAAAILAAPFDHPAFASSPRRIPTPDLNAVDLGGETGLLARLASLPDPRKPRGVRHRVAQILAVGVIAVLCGARSFTAIGECAAELSQALARLGARRSPRTGKLVAPSEATIRRTVKRIDAAALDAVVGEWLLAQVRAGHLEDSVLALAVDGKAVRGAVGADGRAIQLFAAMTHAEGSGPRPDRGRPQDQRDHRVPSAARRTRARRRGRDARPTRPRPLPGRGEGRGLRVHGQGEPARPRRGAPNPAGGIFFPLPTLSTRKATAGSSGAVSPPRPR